VYLCNIERHIGRSGGNRDFDLDTRLEGDGGDLLHNLTGRVEIDETLVNLEFVTIPSLGTFTTRSFTSGNFEHLGGKTNGSLDTELLVLGPVDKVGRKLFEVFHVAAGEGNPDLVDFSTRDWGPGSVVFLFSFGDVTHFKISLMSQKVTKVFS